MTRQASCSCGQLRVEVDGEPLRISVCHCLNCKRRSGSAFAAQARWPRSSARITGTSTQWALTGDEGTTATFHFCATCSATVYYTMSAVPDAIAVPIGAFADPAFPGPSVSVYEERMHAWVAITGDVEHYG